MKKYPVLVTGASGFVGRSLIRTLERENYKVIPVVRVSSGLPEEIVLDFTADDFVQRINEFPQVSAVIHLGTKIRWDGSSRESLFKPNVLVTAELVNWTKSIGAHFIFASTAIVCGAKNPNT